MPLAPESSVKLPKMEVEIAHLCLVRNQAITLPTYPGKAHRPRASAPSKTTRKWREQMVKTRSPKFFPVGALFILLQ